MRSTRIPSYSESGKSRLFSSDNVVNLGGLCIAEIGARAWWDEQLGWDPGDYDEGQKPYGADVESLRRFLDTEILP